MGGKMVVLDSCLEAVESGSRDKGGAKNEGIPSLGAEHLNEWGSFNLDKSKLKYVSEEHFVSMTQGIIHAEDVILVKDGATTGKVSYVDRKFPFEKVAVNEHVFILRTNSKILFSKYLFFFLYSEYGQQEVLKDFRGATVGGISRGFTKIRIPLPSLSEQRRIADILDCVTNLLALHREQLEKLDLLVKSRFVEMFGDPVENPMGWDVVPMNDVLTKIENGVSLNCENFKRTDDKPAILKLSAITYGEYNSNENKQLPERDMFISEVEVHDGDLLFSRKNTYEYVGVCALVQHTPSNLMLPDLIFRLIVNAKIQKFYLCQLINHPIFRPMVQKLASGSTGSMPNISKKRLMELSIPLPPLSLQTQFAAFVEHIDQSKNVIRQSVEKLEILYKALMQKYFAR